MVDRKGIYHIEDGIIQDAGSPVIRRDGRGNHLDVGIDPGIVFGVHRKIAADGDTAA